MQRGHFSRFSIALAAEIGLFAVLNWCDDWTLEQMPVRFVTVAILCGVAYLCAVPRFAFFTSSRGQKIIFWSVALLLRLVALPLTPGDDLWRYKWEGKIQRAGFNPYAHTPDAPELTALRADFRDWTKMNRREFQMLYPPGAELFFAAANVVSDRPLFYKLIFAGADIAAVGVLLSLIACGRSGTRSATSRNFRYFLSRSAPMEGAVPSGPMLAETMARVSSVSEGEPSRYAVAAWYAWNPLVVYTFAGAAHFDSLMILPMMCGVLFLAKYASAIATRKKTLFAFAAAIAFGLAISINLTPLFLLLICAFALGFHAVTLGLTFTIPLLLSLFYGYPDVPIWDSLGRFFYVTRVNDLFWWLIEGAWPNPHEQNYHYSAVLFFAVVFVSLLFFRNWRRGLLWVMGTVLILSPVLHPWYCTWVLPLATWRRAYAWHMLSVTLFSYYLFWDIRLFALPWHPELWMRAIIIVPPLLAVLFAALRQERSQPVGG